MTIIGSAHIAKDTHALILTIPGDARTAMVQNSKHQLKKNTMNGSVITILECYIRYFGKLRKAKFVPGEDLND